MSITAWCYWMLWVVCLQTEAAQAQQVEVWSSAPWLESVKTCENLRWNSVCFWGWKAMRRDNNSKWQTAIHNMGCCVLILNVGGWPPHPLLRGTLSVGFQSEHRDWKCVGMVQRWDNHMSCIVTSCCTSSWKLCGYAGIQYNSSSTSKRPKHVSELLTQIHIRDIQPRKYVKVPYVDTFQKHASCVIPHITNSEANKNIALGCAVNFSKTLILGLSWNHGLVMIPQNPGGFPWEMSLTSSTLINFCRAGTRKLWRPGRRRPSRRLVVSPRRKPPKGVEL